MLTTKQHVPAQPFERPNAHLSARSVAAGAHHFSRSDAGDYWLIPLDRAWAVRSAGGIEAEGFDCIAADRHWIEEREAEEADELAALADFEADQIREAA